MKIRVVHGIGWGMLIILTISKRFHWELFSVLNSGFGGWVSLIIGFTLIFYKTFQKENVVDNI